MVNQNKVRVVITFSNDLISLDHYFTIYLPYVPQKGNYITFWELDELEEAGIFTDEEVDIIFDSVWVVDTVTLRKDLQGIYVEVLCKEEG